MVVNQAMSVSLDKSIKAMVLAAFSLGVLSSGSVLAQGAGTPAATGATPATPAAPAAKNTGSPLIRPETNAYNGSSASTNLLPNVNRAAIKPVAPPDPWKVVSVVENNPSYTVDVKYPQFDPIKGSDPSKLNEEIKRYVYAQIDAARAVMPQKMQHVEGPKPLSYIKGNCIVSAYNQHLCSLEVDLSNYAYQSAHPVEALSTFNFRLDTNQQFGLKDVFRPDFKYVPVVSKICVAALSQGLDEEGTDWVKRGAAPEDKNFIKFQVTPKGLQIVFDPYTVDNGSDGYRSVPIGWDRVRANVSTDAPFKKMLSR